MTNILHYNAPDLMEFDSVITGIRSDGSEVILAETCFYSEGGGQPSDFGQIDVNGTIYKVTAVRTLGDTVYHSVDRNVTSGIVGATVHGSVDKGRRKYHSRHHSALHLLNAFMFQNFNVRVTGGQVGTPGEFSRHDFELDRGLSLEERSRLETWVNQIIAEDRPVTARIFSEEEAKLIPGFCRTRNVDIRKTNGGIRGIEIAGVDIQACGGTHVSRTGEIGKFRVQKIDNKGSNLRRIKIMLA